MPNTDMEKKKSPSKNKRNRKGEITLKILEMVSKMALLPIEIIWAMGVAGYGASMKDFDREIRKFREGESGSRKFGVDSRTKQNYRKLFYKLKKEGFIAEKIEQGGRFLIRTKRGAEKFVRLKNLKDRFLLTSYKYKLEKTDKVVIVIFDVPEKEKWKREWLRNTLRELGMKNVQKSVFIGKVKIPELFLENMRKLHAIYYVEIFEIGKTGTLKHVV